jgi:DNA-binding response OmpR family regulator
MSATLSAADTVLVIEDDEHIAEILRFILERQGYQVVLVGDGRAAQQAIAAAEAPPRMVLLDVMLPHVDGFTLVREIRALPAWANTPIIMLTAKVMEDDIVRALDAGANDYVAKPFQPNELLARVRRYLKPAA